MLECGMSQMSIAQVWWTYQKERFPIMRHGLLVTITTTCVLLFSQHQLTQSNSLLSLAVHILGASLVVLALFFQLRVWDEFKDYADDCQYRAYRPVPRGLIRLAQLRQAAYIAAAGQLLLTVLLAPQALPWLLACWAYMTAMGYEFGNPNGLKARPLLYMLSHLPIVGLIQLMGASWLWGMFGPSPAAWVLFGVSLSAGALLEYGRKIRAAHQEEVGVETYSALWGIPRAMLLWWLAGGLGVAVSYGASLAAVAPVQHFSVILGVYTVLMAGAVALAIEHQGREGLQWLEGLSAVWVLLMYLNLAVGLW